MIDFATLKLTRKPNQHLVAPEGLCGNAAPHAVSPRYTKSASDLMTAVKSVAMSEDRTTVVEEAMEQQHVVFVAKSKIFKFPDFIDVKAVDNGDGTSSLAIYGRAKLGYRDFGVNRKRIDGWLSRL